MSVRLYVLGVLNERDAHGYEMRNLAKEADLAQWTDIGYGSIYHALRRLQDEELIEEVGTEQTGAYPQKTVYRITEEGRRAFLDLLRQTCETVVEPKNPIDLALVFIGQLPPEERVALLKQRLATLEATQRIVRQKQSALKAGGRQFSHVRAVLDHDVMLRQAEIEWMRALINEVADWPGDTLPGAAPAT